MLRWRPELKAKVPRTSEVSEPARGPVVWMSKAQEPFRAPVARMSEAQVMEDEIAAPGMVDQFQFGSIS